MRDNNINKLDIVFCLDLSGSTNGLISDVREGLWHIVNQVNLMEPQPQFRIAIVGFSRPSYKKENGYVKVICDLTADYDMLSNELVKIRPAIEKGDQYVGIALNTCINKLSWDEAKSTRKIIYIVGNGMVNTNNSDYIKACQQALQHNIIVNTVYVIGKSDKARELPGWYRIAALTNGVATEMTVGKKLQLTDTKLDFSDLFEASRDLNLSYIYHGTEGLKHYSNFRAADSAAFTYGPSIYIERAYYKNSSLFKWANSKWDMVDFFRMKGMLPPMQDSLMISDSLRSMSAEAIYDLVNQQKSMRQKAINDLEYLLRADYPMQVHKQYISGELLEENSFARSVILLLIKEWN